MPNVGWKLQTATISGYESGLIVEAPESLALYLKNTIKSGVAASVTVKDINKAHKSSILQMFMLVVCYF